MSLASSASVAAVNNKVASTANVAQNIGSMTIGISPGNVVVAVLASDNLGAVDGPTNEHLALNFNGLPLTKIREVSNAGGGASQGATCSIWIYVPFESIGNGPILATFSGAVTAKACTAWRFTKDPANVIDLAPGGGSRLDTGTDPESLAVVTSVSGREHLFIRGMAGESNSTAHTPGGSMTGFTNAQTSGGGAATNIAARGAFQIITQGTLTTDPIVAAGDWASIGLALYERPGGPGSSPVNTTIIDDFNRADGLFTAGAVWNGKVEGQTNPASLGVVSNQMRTVNPAQYGGGARSSVLFGPDVDYVFDLVRAPMNNSGGLRFYFAIIGDTWQSTGYRVAFEGYNNNILEINRKVQDNQVMLRSISHPGGPWISGSQLWISMRGSVISVYERVAGPWTLLTSVTDATYNRAGYFAFEIADTNLVEGNRILVDNFSGGTAVGSPDAPVSKGSRVIV